MKNRKEKQTYCYMLWLLIAIGFGAVIGLTSGLFVMLQHYISEFIWEYIPHVFNINTPFYQVITPAVGGLLIGYSIKIFGHHPQPISEVMEKNKKKELKPEDMRNVPKAFLIALLSIIFGGPLGPESAVIGIVFGCIPLASYVLERFQKQHLKKLKNKIASKIPAILGVVAGLAIFALLSISIFGLSYEFSYYNYSLGSLDLVWVVALALLGYLLGFLYKKTKNSLKTFIKRTSKNPVLLGMVGGLILGLLGLTSEWIFFSGQTGLSELLAIGPDLSWQYLTMVGLLKYIAAIVTLTAGWKGGEIFPVMFAASALGMGLGNLLGIDQTLAIAAISGSSVSVVLGNAFIAVPILLIFLPLETAVPLIVAALVSFILDKTKVKHYLKK